MGRWIDDAWTDDETGIWIKPTALQCGRRDSTPCNQYILNIGFEQRKGFADGVPYAGVDTQQRKVLLINVDRNDYTAIVEQTERLLRQVDPKVFC